MIATQTEPKIGRKSDLLTLRLSIRPLKSLNEVGRESGVDKSALSKYERGLLMISRGTAMKLAAYYSKLLGYEISAGEMVDAGMESWSAGEKTRKLADRRAKARARRKAESPTPEAR